MPCWYCGKKPREKDKLFCVDCLNLETKELNVQVKGISVDI